jgi:hypothetical protein
MSPDCSNELLAAIRVRLLAEPAVAAIVGTRVFDRPDMGVDFPWLQIGETLIQPFEAHCVTGASIFFTLHGWGRDGHAGDDMRALGAAVYASLHAQRFPLPEPYALQLIEHQSTQVLRDPDGTTRHLVTDYRADTTADL